jgi:cytochrome c
MRRTEMNSQEHLEARRWVEDAIAFLENTGKENTLEEIADPKGRFVLNDRNIFAMTPIGTMLAHPVEPELVGKNLMGLKDAEGKAFIRRIVSSSRTKGCGFSDYVWHRPGSDDELYKTVFFERVDGMILCSGFYTSKEDFLDGLLKWCGPY